MTREIKDEVERKRACERMLQMNVTNAVKKRRKRECRDR